MMPKKRKKKSKAVHLAEYALLRVVCALVNAVPYRLACALARAAAWTAFTVFGFQRKRTLERLRTVFPDKSPAEHKRIAVFSLANVLQNAVEMIRAPRFDKKWITAHVADIALYADKLRAVLAEGKGAVIVVPHTGNWYMAAWAMAQYGIPLTAVAARQRNPYINDWMRRQYGTIEVLERGSSIVLHNILARVKSGRGFAILPDLRVPYPDTPVPFLNGTANVSHGCALLAVKTGAPVVVAVMRRENNRHTFDHLATLRPDPSNPDPSAEATRLTQEIFTHLTPAILSTPEQWFWYNKRWILQPV